MVHIEKVDGIF